MFFGCSDGMEREACVCDHGYERSDLCAEIIIIIIMTSKYQPLVSRRQQPESIEIVLDIWSTARRFNESFGHWSLP